MPTTNPTDSLDKSGRATKWNALKTESTINESEPARSAPNSTQLRKRFVIRCCLLLITIIVLSLDYYRHGLQLETTGPFSSTILFSLAIPVFFIRSLSTSIDIVRGILLRKHSKKNLLLLPILPAALVFPYMLKLPSFTEGAARTLIALNISNLLVAAVAEELAKPRDDSWKLEHDREKEVLTREPFSRLGLKYADLRFEESSLLFEFGSPIAGRWGISISGVKNKPPTLPNYGSDPIMVSREILVYTNTPD